MAAPMTRVLSSSQLAMLAEHGEERTAEVGETLFQIGDTSYPFVAILERRGRRDSTPPARRSSATASRASSARSTCSLGRRCS